jgi:hypothetical protein
MAEDLDDLVEEKRLTRPKDDRKTYPGRMCECTHERNSHHRTFILGASLAGPCLICKCKHYRLY